jgi:ferrous iron transport protein A
MTSLAKLVPGDQATIAGIRADAALRQRLAALGFRIGQRVELVRRGVFSGPLHVRLGTTDVILRRRQAAQIDVVPAAAGLPSRT